MKNTIINNIRQWDEEYYWSNDGDEWDGQARHCKKSYDNWKQSLVDYLIKPYVNSSSVVLEIAPGHGRWSAVLAPMASHLLLVDISPSCIDFCRKRFDEFTSIGYFISDGQSLAMIQSQSIDFIWSFDSFVHIDENTTKSYFQEFARTLKSGGTAVIHHPGRRHSTLWLGFIRHWGEFGKQLYKVISMGRFADHDGWRANISAKYYRDLASENGLEIKSQLQFWDEKKTFGVPRFNDFITILQKPSLF